MLRPQRTKTSRQRFVRAHVDNPLGEQYLRFVPTVQLRFKTTPYDWQGHAIQAVMHKRDVIVRAGTGSGKSLIFQAAALFHPKAIVLVFSPLLGLMDDQVRTIPGSSEDNTDPVGDQGEPVR